MAQLVFPLNVRAQTRTTATLSCLTRSGSRMKSSSEAGLPPPSVGGAMAMSVSSIMLLIQRRSLRS